MSDVLLINAGGQPEIFQGLSPSATAKEPPIWDRFLATYLRARRMDTFILDAEALDLSPAVVANIAQGYRPRLIVIVVHGHQPSASTQKMVATTETVRELKQLLPDVPVLLVGGHVAALPARSLIETGADFVCTGEGPVTTYELAWAIKHNQPIQNVRGLVFDGGTISRLLPGIYYHPDSSIIRWTKPAPNVEDLDRDLPGGSWELLPMKAYRSYGHHGWTNGMKREPYASIYTSLGCPYACSFCMIQTPFRQGDQLRSDGKDIRFYRKWSADTVIKEIETLVEHYGVTNIRINDEMFVLHEPHVISICDKVIERYGDRLNFWCYGRVDQTKEKFLEKMRQAGFKWICLGIESMSEHVREGVDKSEYGMDEIFKTVRRIQNHGINIIGNYMFGLPDDTLESMQQTLDMALELRTEYVNFYATVIYPGSLLWDLKINTGWKPPESWLAWSFHSYEHEPAGTNTLSPAEVLKFRDQAYQTYMRDPSYLDLVRRKFGRAVAESVVKTADIPLRRKLLEESSHGNVPDGV